MKKPILAVDIDDVLSPHYDLLVAHLSSAFATDLTVMEVRNLNTLTAKTGAELPDIVNSIDGFILSEYFYVDPLPGAIEAIEKLKAKYHLVIVTARPTNIQKHTEAWVHKHFPNTFNKVDFVGGLSWGNPTNDKAPRLLELGAEILIDDSPRHGLVASQAGIRVLLFGNYVWNQLEELPANMTRVDDWSSVLRELL